MPLPTGRKCLQSTVRKCLFIKAESTTVKKCILDGNITVIYNAVVTRVLMRLNIYILDVRYCYIRKQFVNLELCMGNMWAFDLWFFLLQTSNFSHTCSWFKISSTEQRVLLDTSEILQQCSEVKVQFAVGSYSTLPLYAYIVGGSCHITL